MSDTSNKTNLSAKFYLFGVDYPFKVDGVRVYDNLNTMSHLDPEKIKNIRPMSRLPVAVNLDSDWLQLWGTDHLGQRYSLGYATQKNATTGMHQLLVPGAPVQNPPQKKRLQSTSFPLQCH